MKNSASGKETEHISVWMERHMHRTGIEDYYIIRRNKKLRFGYTTGTCAAAASKGAALMLLSGHPVSSVSLMTPKGIFLDLEILEAVCSRDCVSCAVRKDAGDDPDVTDGILVYSRISRRTDGEIRIEGGTGVGRVTRSGMKQAVGQAAINPVPLRMIREAVEEVCSDFEYTGGLDVEISIPDGVELASRTFNPRLGIEGGISVLGTSGIVEPMSQAALIESIRLEMEMKKSSGHAYLVVTPGNYGEAFTRNEMSIDLSGSLKCGNYVGETLDMAVNMGIRGILFVAHIGKFIKVAGGIMNTHSRDADCRAELMAAFALRAGGDRELACRILDSVTTDEALELMDNARVRNQAMKLAAKSISRYLRNRTAGAIETEAVLFSGSFGFLAQTGGAEQMLKHFEKQKDVLSGKGGKR